MELFWTILNTVLFIIVCFKANLAIRKELGFWSFLFLALCLFSFAFSKNETDNEKHFTIENRMKVQNSFKTNAIQKFVVTEHVLSDQLLSTINLRVKFKGTESELAIVSAQDSLMVQDGSLNLLMLRLRISKEYSNIKLQALYAGL
ncbi:hypothetical protein CMV00_11760 [Elizabethkingia anophelis]|nr:hypothetical protein [Elizabethkingia anophelis]